MLNIKIAWRNIFRHKGKSLIIGAILFLGAFIMTLGNGIITGMNRGFQENVVERFCGDIVIISEKQRKEAVVFNTIGDTIEVISNYPQINEVLVKQSYLNKHLPVAMGAAMVLNDNGEPDFNYLLGVDFAEYQKMFGDNLTVLEGRLLQPGERGFLLNTVTREFNYKYLLGYWVIPEGTQLVTANLIPEASADLSRLKVKDSLIYMGFNESNSTYDILASVKGVIKFKQLNKMLGFFSIIDIASYRECFGYFTSDTNVNLSAKKQKIMESDNLDDLFGSASMYQQQAFDGDGINEAELKKEVKREDKPVDFGVGQYNQIYIKLKANVGLDEGVNKLNLALKEANLGVRAITWKKGLGEMADMAILMKSALFIFIMFIFFVAIIIIMNTLSMAALERSSEIGMMRAVGARKSFITLMFFWETSLLSFVFGGAGIVCGYIVVRILDLLNLTTANEMMQLFYGGDTFSPFLGAGDIVMAVIQLVIVTLVAMVYPVIVARRITPLQAIARD